VGKYYTSNLERFSLGIRGKTVGRVVQDEKRLPSDIKESVFRGFQTSKLNWEWGDSPVSSGKLDLMISKNLFQPVFSDSMICMLVKFDSYGFLHKLRIYRKAQKCTVIYQ